MSNIQSEATEYAAYRKAKRGSCEHALCLGVWREWNAALKQLRAASAVRSSVNRASAWVDLSDEREAA